MTQQAIPGVEFWCLNTDAQVQWHNILAYFTKACTAQLLTTIVVVIQNLWTTFWFVGEAAPRQNTLVVDRL
jgi:hypothetical protein